MFDPRTPARRFVTLNNALTVLDWLAGLALLGALCWLVKVVHP